MPERLAVQSDSVIGQRAIERAHPSLQARIELRRVEPSEHSAKCVVRWDAAGKLEKPGKPFLLLVAEPLDISPPLGPADCCAQGDDDHIDQQMTLRPVHSWIGQIIEV